MEVIELDHYNIKAPAETLPVLTRFYTEVIGLSEGFRPNFKSRGVWLYASDRALLHLTEGEVNPAINNGPFNHIAFKCNGLSDTIKRLDSLGIKYHRSEVHELGQIQLFMQDPLGVSIELNFNTAG